jgi:pimeloyl-ACP methyl ester carboxylesterase
MDVRRHLVHLMLRGDMQQHIRYCETADGVRIAYAVMGKGPPIIRTSHWLTHLQYDLTSPVWRHVLLGLARHHTVVRFDARGEGLSERHAEDITFDGWMKDLVAVVEAAGFPTFTLFGCSQGAGTALQYASEHPDRVSRLILYGGFARGLSEWKDDDQLRLGRDLILQGWGVDRDAHRQWFTSLFLPGGTPEQARWFNHMQKMSATPDVAVKHFKATADFDVTTCLPSITTPTLVLHSSDDAVIPESKGQAIAAKVPNARYVALEGDNHLFLAGSRAHRDFLASVADFLGDPPPPSRLPGTDSLADHLGRTVLKMEHNWLIKLALIAGGVIGLIATVLQFAGGLG